jgi:hypothetical protein
MSPPAIVIDSNLGKTWTPCRSDVVCPSLSSNGKSLASGSKDGSERPWLLEERSMMLWQQPHHKESDASGHLVGHECRTQRLELSRHETVGSWLREATTDPNAFGQEERIRMLWHNPHRQESDASMPLVGYEHHPNKFGLATHSLWQRCIGGVLRGWNRSMPATKISPACFLVSHSKA